MSPEQPPSAFSLDVTTHARRWCGLLYSIHIPSLKLVGLPVSKTLLIFSHSDKRPSDLDLWPSFWPLNGSPASWAYFLSIFNFLRPSVLDLGSGRGQTDRQTDRRRLSMHNSPTVRGRGMKKRIPYIQLPLVFIHILHCGFITNYRVSKNRTPTIFCSNFTKTHRLSMIFAARRYA